MLETKRETSFISNPFHAPVYYFESTASTMQEARTCVSERCPSGTFVYAGFQTGGRGRIAGRQWVSPARENLLGTLILRRSPSTDFTLRIGLAVSLTLDSFLPPRMRTAVKWPNDIFIDGKKTSGILCEAYGDCVLAGFGINLLQTAFKSDIAQKATSLAAVVGIENCPSFEVFIPTLLSRIRDCLDYPDWHERISGRLWKRGTLVRFMRGIDAHDLASGILTGIAQDGALCIAEADGEHRYYSGELIL